MKTAKNILSAMLALLVLVMGMQFPVFAQEGEIAITSSAQLIEELGTGKTLVLTDGIYTIDKTLEISNIENLTVKAEHSGKAEILSTDGYTPVVKIVNSKGITLEGLILGHESLSYQYGCGSGQYSSGYVVLADTSENVAIKGCDLYGCGTVGTVINGVNGFLAESCVIRDCKEYAVKASGENIVFENCVISGNAYDQNYARQYPAVDASASVTFNNCIFLNNKSTAFKNGENVTVTNCTFENNVWDNKIPEDYGICLNGITWRVEEVSNYEYALCLGFPLEPETETIESELGEILPYSTYSLPWRGSSRITQIKVADGVTYNITGKCGDDVTYELSVGDGKLSIKGSGRMYDYSSMDNIPWYMFSSIIKTIEVGEGVTSISPNAFYTCRNAEEVSLGEGLEEIGYDAFASCYALKSMKLPESLKTIGSSAFTSCQSIEEITVPKNVLEIGKYAFDNCDALKAINVDKDNVTYTSVDGVLYDKNLKILIKYPEAKPDEKYVTPATVETVSPFSLSSCNSLKTIVLSEGVKTIGKRALFGCEKLETVSLPESLETIEIFQGMDVQNFSRCQALKEINAADGNKAFSSDGGVLYDKNKTRLIAYPAGAGFSYAVPEGVTHIEECAFSGGNITAIELPSTVESIGSRAFCDCLNLTEVVVPKNTLGTAIGSMAFLGCESLEAVVLPITVTTIDRNVFGRVGKVIIYGEGGTPQTYAEENGIAYKDMAEYVPKEEIKGEGWSLKSGILTLSSNVEYSEWSRYSEQIKVINVLEGVTAIPEYAFRGTDAIAVSLPESLEVIGDMALPTSYRIKSVYIGKNVREIGRDAFGENTAAEVSPDNPYFMSENRALYTKDKTRLLSIGSDYAVTSYTLPKTVTQIDEPALTGRGGGSYFTEILVEDGNMAYCSVDGVLYNKDKTVVVAYPSGRIGRDYVMPESVTAVGNSAFFYADLTSITLSSSLSEIGDYAFSGCKVLTGRLTLPAGVKTIGESAFGSCRQLTGIDLPSGLLSIGRDAFLFCEGIEEIVVPRSVRTIGGNAFYGCKSLKSITLSAGMKKLERSTVYNCAALEKLVIPSSITEIEENAIARCPNVTIYSAEGSAAEAFARANSIPFAAIEESEPQIISAEVNAADGGVAVSVEAKNTDGTVMFAVGYSDGKPVDYAVVEDKTAKLSGEGMSVVKVFCWESLESMKPLCPAKTVEVK